MKLFSLFVTRLYQSKLDGIDPDELENSCFSIAEDDEAGQDWCEREGFPGYTSYASLTDLPWRFPIFKDLVAALDKHVAAFAEGGIHTSRIHPHSGPSPQVFADNSSVWIKIPPRQASAGHT